MKTNLVRTLLAGLAATLVMTVIMLMAPAMGLPPMNVGAMLGSVMGGSLILGWMGHFLIGAGLAVGYAALFAERLPGSPMLRGAIFSLLPWLMAQVIVMPMMGMGLFSGSISAAGGSLIGHVVYGLVLGLVLGAVPAPAPRHARI